MKKLSLFILLILTAAEITACTIFSAKDAKGNVWAGNNEDYVFTFDTYMNCQPRTDSAFGYIWFSYNGSDDVPQGGFNDQGLFFDANSVPASDYKDFDLKKDFPGGDLAMTKYILARCSTVTQVMEIFKQYRSEGLPSGQLHFADRFGNLGIIVADSMWLSPGKFQVSTNYNLCHADKDGELCWRYPIAERLLGTKKIGYETFRLICDSTSQKSWGSTLYSNIHNLSTGECWLFYGLDYRHPLKTNIRELLKAGKRSIRIADLFPSAPLVICEKIYLSDGADAAMKKFRTIRFSSSEERLQTLRLFALDRIVMHHDFGAKNFLDSIFVFHRDTLGLLSFIRTGTLLHTGHRTEAELVLLQATQSLHDSEIIASMRRVFNQYDGIFDSTANAHFELSGYSDAHSVYIDGLSDPNFLHFMAKKNGKWFADFKLPPGENIYCFVIDGKRILDPANPQNLTEWGQTWSVIKVPDSK